MNKQVRNCDRCGKPFVETYKEYLCRDCLDDLGWNATYHTNADRIRSMTDDELGGLLDSVYGEGWIDGAAEEWENDFSYCDWLKQPYKEDA